MRQGLWNKLGDAAALVGADSKIDGGGGAGFLFVVRKKMGKEGKMKVPVRLIYKRTGG